MNGPLIISASPFLSAGITALWVGVSRLRRPLQIDPLHICLAAFAGAVFLFSLGKAYGGWLGPIEAPVAILGSVTCGTSWLLTRALFRAPDKPVIWPLMVMAALIATTAIIVLTPDAQAASGVTGAIVRVSRNIQTLVSSTVLVLTLLEPINGFSKALPRPERRFRLIFIVSYATLVTVAVLLQTGSGSGPAADQLRDAIKVSCAVISLAVAIAAVAFRNAHPFYASRASPKRAAPTPETEHLRERILQVISQQELYKIPELRVADIARCVGEPTYKISQSINGLMGFQNFNRLINSFRIEAAKVMLSDARLAEKSILAVAMDCGFGSIGPFNRAFKDSVGMTPMQFRAQYRRESN